MKLRKKRSKPIKIVEFFGMPGTGKTYITKKLSSKNKDKQKYFHMIDVYGKYSFTRKLRKTLSLWIYFFNLNIFFNLIKIVSFFPELKFSKKIKILFNFLLIISVILRNNNSKEIFFDQGIFQSFYSCFFYSNNFPLSMEEKKALKNFISKLTKKLMVERFEINHLLVSDDVIKNRIRNRSNKGTSPINKLNSETYIKSKVSINKAVELFQLFESDGKFRIKELENQYIL